MKSRLFGFVACAVLLLSVPLLVLSLEQVEHEREHAVVPLRVGGAVDAKAIAVAKTTPMAKDNFPCGFKGYLGSYDLSVFNTTQIVGNGTDGWGNWLIYLQLCAVAPGTPQHPCKGIDAMACQVFLFPSYGQWVAAYPDDRTGQHWWTEVSDGIYLIAYGLAGGICKDSQVPAVIIHFICDPSVSVIPTELSAPILFSPTCEYIITLTHKAACPIPTRAIAN